MPPFMLCEVDIDANNAFRINNIGTIISTSETLQAPESDAQNSLQVQCHVPYPCAPNKIRDTITLIPMRREVQGQGHSNTILSLLMTTRGGAVPALSLGVDVFMRKVAVW
jgi:hypothetical protein